MKFESSGIISYPEHINELSRVLGKLRDITNTEMNESNPRFKRGDRSEFVNILGVRGELIIRNFLSLHDIKFQSAPILSYRPAAEPDIVIGDRRIDVKTLRTDAPDLLVNREAHERISKSITHYWFVQPTSETTARYWIYPHSNVSTWSIKTVTYTEAYYLPLG